MSSFQDLWVFVHNNPEAKELRVCRVELQHEREYTCNSFGPLHQGYYDWKPLNFEITTSSVLSVLLLIYDPLKWIVSFDKLNCIFILFPLSVRNHRLTLIICWIWSEGIFWNKFTSSQFDSLNTSIYIKFYAMFVCLFVCPLIAQKPHHRFASSFNWGTQESHENILSLVLRF